MNELQQCVAIVLEKCLAVKNGENVLIVSDETTEEIAGEFFRQASLKNDAVQMKIKPTGAHGKEPPSLVSKAMKEFDVVICPLKYSITHTKARKDATKKGARIATLPGITMEILTKTIPIEYGPMEKQIKSLADKMRKAKKIKVITNAGTNFYFENDGTRVIDDDTGIYVKKGDFGNLPAGEVFVAPLEKTSNGVIVIDMMEDLCKPKTKVYVKKGEAQEIEGDDAFRDRLWKLKNARNIAEFGIGMNPKATIKGSTIIDEKVKGTCHIAFGSSFAIRGKVRADVHWDGIIIAPTIFFDDEKIMDNGELL